MSEDLGSTNEKIYENLRLERKRELDELRKQITAVDNLSNTYTKIITNAADTAKHINSEMTKIIEAIVDPNYVEIGHESASKLCEVLEFIKTSDLDKNEQINVFEEVERLKENYIFVLKENSKLRENYEKIKELYTSITKIVKDEQENPKAYVTVEPIEDETVVSFNSTNIATSSPYRNN